MLSMEIGLWLGLAFLAAALLMKMMRRRQLALIGLLKEHVERQSQWAKRRSKAEQLAAQENAPDA